MPPTPEATLADLQARAVAEIRIFMTNDGRVHTVATVPGGRVQFNAMFETARQDCLARMQQAETSPIVQAPSLATQIFGRKRPNN